MPSTLFGGFAASPSTESSQLWGPHPNAAPLSLHHNEPTSNIKYSDHETLYFGAVSFKDVTGSRRTATSGKLLLVRLRGLVRMLLLDLQGNIKMKQELHPEVKVSYNELETENPVLIIKAPSSSSDRDSDLHLELRFDGDQPTMEMWCAAMGIVKARAVVKSQKDKDEQDLIRLINTLQLRH